MSRELFGLVLLCVQVGINLPVIIKLIKAKTGEGLSISGEIIWIAGGIGWVIYGILTNSLTLIISGSLAAIACLIISGLLFKYSRPNMLLPMLLGGFTLVSIIVSTWLMGVTGLSVVLSIFGVVQFMPQLLLTISNIRTKTIPFGVSTMGSAFRAVYTGGWAIYAGAWVLWSITVEQIDWPLLFWGIAGVITFGLQALYSFLMRQKTSLP
jgi:uncharacterized protein with PQ loop repeat